LEDTLRVKRLLGTDLVLNHTDCPGSVEFAQTVEAETVRTVAPEPEVQTVEAETVRTVVLVPVRIAAEAVRTAVLAPVRTAVPEAVRTAVLAPARTVALDPEPVARTALVPVVVACCIATANTAAPGLGPEVTNTAAPGVTVNTAAPGLGPEVTARKSGCMSDQLPAHMLTDLLLTGTAGPLAGRQSAGCKRVVGRQSAGWRLVVGRQFVPQTVWVELGSCNHGGPHDQQGYGNRRSCIAWYYHQPLK